MPEPAIVGTDIPDTLIGSYTYQKGEKALELKEEDRNKIDAKEAFINEDHWQEGRGWIGPIPVTPEGVAVIDNLKARFVSKNMLLAIVDRENNAVIGHQPQWTITVRRQLKKVPKQIPDPVFLANPENTGKEAPMIDDPTGAKVDEPLDEAEQKLVDELNALLVQWWDKQQALKAFQTGTRRKEMHKRGYLRLFVPTKKLKAMRNGDGTVKTVDAETAVKSIFIEAPEYVDATIITDPLSMDQLGLTRFKVGESDVIEAVGLDDQGNTIIKTMPAESSNIDPSQSTPLPLGGRLTLFALEGKNTITEQQISLQKLLNLNLTLCGHNLVEFGFSEETFLNAEMEEDEVLDLTAPGGKRKVPKALPRGAGASRNVVGLQYYDRDGKQHIATPGIHEREPAAADTYVATYELVREAMLDDAHQLHALISGDASPSGESRITALADFIIYCLDSKTAVDSAGVWSLETVAAFIAILIGEPGKYDSLRVNFNAKIDPGRLTPEERQALMTEVDKKLRSRKSYMMLTGESDPDAQMSEIIGEERIFTQLRQPTPVPDPKQLPAE